MKTVTLRLLRLKLYSNSTYKTSLNSNYNESFDLSVKLSCSLEYKIGVTALLVTALNGHRIQLLKFEIEKILYCLFRISPPARHGACINT